MDEPNWTSIIPEEELFLFSGTEDFWHDLTIIEDEPFETPQMTMLEEFRDFVSTVMIPEQPFQVLSTIRYDRTLVSVEDFNKAQAVGEIPEACFFLLKIHHQRLLATRSFFTWNVDITYERLLEELRAAVAALDSSKPYKMRVLMSKDGELTVEASEVARRTNLFSGLTWESGNDNPHFTVYLDKDYIVIGPFTSFKTTQREQYNKARERSLKPNGPKYQEVLLYNGRDHVTEGSISNVAFFRNGGWKTPPLASGCLCGVVRHYLMSRKVLQEEPILKSSLRDGEPLFIFNGIMGVCRGTLRIE